ARVRLGRRTEADVLAHRPQAISVHVAMDAARERIFSRLSDVAGGIAPGEVLGAVDRLHRDVGMQLHVPHDVASWKNFTISGSAVPIGNTRAMPNASSASTSLGGMVPPTITRMSPAPCARRP